MNALSRNNKVKIVILLITAICLSLGIILLKRMNVGKIESSANLFDFLAPEAQFWVYSKDLKSTASFTRFPRNYENFFRSWKQYEESSPSLILCRDSGFVLCGKVSKEQERNVIDSFLQKKYPLFPYKSISIGKTRYYFYATKEDSFFVCSFVQGVFLGSYDFRFLRVVVDSYFQRENLPEGRKKKNFPDFHSSKEKVLFGDCRRPELIFSLSKKEKGVLVFTAQKDTTLSTASFTKSQPNFALLPDSLSAFRYATHVDFPLDSRWLHVTQGDCYQFTISSRMYGNGEVEVIPLKKNIHLIDSIRKRFSISVKGYPFLSFFGQYYLYNGYYLRKNIAKNNSSPLYWTQWHNYLIVSADMNTIVRYVRRKETYKDRMSYAHLLRSYDPACSEFLFFDNAFDWKGLSSVPRDFSFSDAKYSVCNLFYK